MTTILELIKTIEDESVMTDKAKAAFLAVLSAQAVIEARLRYYSNAMAKSQDFVWLGDFAKRPPARNLFSEHRGFIGAANQ